MPPEYTRQKAEKRKKQKIEEFPPILQKNLAKPPETAYNRCKAFSLHLLEGWNFL